MKIGNSADLTKPAPTATPAGAAADAAKTLAPAIAAATPPKPDASTKLQLSSTAATLMAAGGTPEFDAEKVARVSKAIANGSFKVNADVIADKLISNAQEALTKVQR